MIVICALLQVLCVVLAILSRIHFSKYKDLVPHKEIRTMLACSIICLFVSASLAEMFILKNQSNDRKEIVFTRKDYSGEVQTENIVLTHDDKQYAYALDIYPRQYTEEQFLELSQEKIGEIRNIMLGNNMDFEHVTEDLTLPKEDEMGIFAYRWISDNPEVLSSYGVVHTDEIADSTPVMLTLQISYLSYVREEKIPLVVIKEMRRENVVADVKAVLSQLENDTRTSEIVTLPKEYEGVQISLNEDKKTQAKRCLAVGVILAFLFVPLAKIKMKEEEKKRNDALKNQYPSFVSSLCLLLGSGMTIRLGIRQILSTMKEDVLLKRELEYAMHQIDNGSEEAWTYEQLGRRLRVPEYYQLMQHISQHIRMGTKDLRNLMEEEAQFAMKKRRELAKKHGEEASTKLLFPMVVLLATVMLIVVYPAMMGL